MADKAISELISAERVKATDLLVMEQDGAAKKLTGQILLNWLTAAADGHGGISSIVKQSTSGLTDTYRITLADTTTFDFPVKNGRNISTISKVSTSGLKDTYRITYNDSTTSTFTVANGAKGDKGDNAYVWIRYASQQPTAASHNFGALPDNWMGVYSGNSATAPTDWTQYQWFEIKGEKGDTGNPATLVSSSVMYMVSDSGSIVPSGSWGSTIPTVPQGKYLWTRVIQTYNTGSPITSYSVSRFGLDGTGSVSSVNSQSPDSTGNVNLTAADIAVSDGQSVEAVLDEAAALLYNSAGAHNAIYRGKNLGTSVTAAQWAAIAAGTFEDMYIGDYWVIGGVTYRIAAFDYYYKTGDTSCDTHHITLVPDGNMYTHVMNDTNVTTGADVGSKMYTTGLSAAKTTINNAFGSAHILNHRQYLKNAVTNGYESAGSWYDSTVELMTEQNVYGGKVFANCTQGTNWAAQYTVDKSQYPLFAHRPDMISNRAWFWLRDVASAADFGVAGGNGDAVTNYASYVGGVRPAFSIKS